ncbi:hypothetical protein [Dactylosporangium sp. NPDC049140]|uniref:hypothetical protein n=1 Tax=Dactylosporangium sp. NPDC049140 TaxID=3155647 RepID=UPI00340E0E85
MTTSTEGGQPQPEADDQLDLSAEMPTRKAYEPPLQPQDELRAEAVVTPLRIAVSWAARVRADLGPTLAFAASVIPAIAALTVVAVVSRDDDGPNPLGLLLAVAVGAGVLFTGLKFLKPSTRRERG